MAIEKIYLDPNATSYTDDEIVGKVNTATAKVNADATEDGVTNKVFTVTDETKLTGIEANAKDDQTGAEIKTVYEAEANAYTDIKDTKLTGVEDSATADQTGAEIRDSVVGLADDARGILITRALTGQKKIYAIQTHTDGKQEIEQSDTPEV